MLPQTLWWSSQTVKLRVTLTQQDLVQWLKILKIIVHHKLEDEIETVKLGIDYGF